MKKTRIWTIEQSVTRYTEILAQCYYRPLLRGGRGGRRNKWTPKPNQILAPTSNANPNPPLPLSSIKNNPLPLKLPPTPSTPHPLFQIHRPPLRRGLLSTLPKNFLTERKILRPTPPKSLESWAWTFELRSSKTFNPLRR